MNVHADLARRQTRPAKIRATRVAPKEETRQPARAEKATAKPKEPVSAQHAYSNGYRLSS